MCSQKIKIQVCLLLILVFISVPATHADLVKLYNGDRISGKVEKLKDGKLIFKTEWAGSIQISWSSIDSLESDDTLSVMTSGGDIYSGFLRKADSALKVANDQETNRLQAVDIVSISPTRGTFWQRVDGSFHFGYSMPRGSSDSTQSSLSTSVNYDRPDYSVHGEIVSTLNEPGDGQATSRHTLDTRYDRFLNRKSFLFVLGGLERNEQQLLNLRTKVGGGLARKVINTRKTTVSFLGGFNFANEKYRFENFIDLPAANSGEGLAVFDLRTTRLAGIEFMLRVAIHPALTKGGRYRIESDSSIRIPITKNFMWGLSLDDRFDSQPPVPVDRNDYGVISTLGYKF